MKKVIMSMLLAIILMVNVVSATIGIEDEHNTCIDGCYAGFCEEEYFECKKTDLEYKCFIHYCDESRFNKCIHKCEDRYLKDDATIYNEYNTYSSGGSGMSDGKFERYLERFIDWFKNIFATREEVEVLQIQVCELKADMRIVIYNLDTGIKAKVGDREILIAKCLENI